MQAFQLNNVALFFGKQYRIKNTEIKTNKKMQNINPKKAF